MGSIAPDQQLLVLVEGLAGQDLIQDLSVSSDHVFDMILNMSPSPVLPNISVPL